MKQKKKKQRFTLQTKPNRTPFLTAPYSIMSMEHWKPACNLSDLMP